MLMPSGGCLTKSVPGQCAAAIVSREHGRALCNTKQSAPFRQRRPAQQLTVTRADMFQNMINQLSEVVTNSPVNNLKKGIAKVQAGDYDEAAIKSKLDSYLKDNDVRHLCQITCNRTTDAKSACLNKRLF